VAKDKKKTLKKEIFISTGDHSYILWAQLFSLIFYSFWSHFLCSFKFLCCNPFGSKNLRTVKKMENVFACNSRTGRDILKIPTDFGSEAQLRNE
jgi:hypothetical protein